MMKLGIGFALLFLATTSYAQIQQDDFVFAYNQGEVPKTLELYRENVNGDPSSYSSLGNPWANGSTAFMRSVEFDNLNGVQHNAQGNLIGADLGTSAAGGSISTLATDGTANGTPLASFNGTAGFPRTRLGSPAVSPKNQKLCVTGYDSGELYIVDYHAGTGDGRSGSVSHPRMTDTGATISVVTNTQGSAWLNERTALVFNGNGQLTAVDSTDMSTRVVADVAATEEGMAFSVTDVDFEPAISPYVYAMNGVRNSDLAITTNTLYVFDPRDDFSLVGQFDFSAIDPSDPIGVYVMQAAREIAFDSQGNLLVSQFVISGFVGTQIGVDYIPGAYDPANIVDNMSFNTGFLAQYSANFNGIDVANSTVIVPGDGDTDGTVTGADFVIWSDHFGYGLEGPTEGLATVQMGDYNCDGAVTGADYTVWADNFGAGTRASSVPEPASMLLAGVALLGGLLGVRRRQRARAGNTAAPLSAHYTISIASP